MVKIENTEDDNDEFDSEVPEIVCRRHDSFLSIDIKGVLTSKILNEITDTIIIENQYFHDVTEIINVFIDSPGGEAHPTLKLIDTFECSRIPIRTIGWGKVCSAAFLLLMSGHKGYRYISNNATIMSHQATNFTEEMVVKLGDVFALYEEFRILHALMLDTYQRKSGLSKAKIRRSVMKNHDSWLTPKQVVEMGFADEFLQNNPSIIWNNKEMLEGREKFIDSKEKVS